VCVHLGSLLRHNAIDFGRVLDVDVQDPALHRGQLVVDIGGNSGNGVVDAVLALALSLEVRNYPPLFRFGIFLFFDKLIGDVRRLIRVRHARVQGNFVWCWVLKRACWVQKETRQMRCVDKRTSRHA
jgi:hypothetical protein